MPQTLTGLRLTTAPNMVRRNAGAADFNIMEITSALRQSRPAESVSVSVILNASAVRHLDFYNERQLQLRVPTINRHAVRRDRGHQVFVISDHKLTQNVNV